MNISEVTWWKARDMEQAETRMSLWTTTSHRHSPRSSSWATPGQRTSTGKDNIRANLVSSKLCNQAQKKNIGVDEKFTLD